MLPLALLSFSVKYDSVALGHCGLEHRRKWPRKASSGARSPADAPASRSVASQPSSYAATCSASLAKYPRI